MREKEVEKKLRAAVKKKGGMAPKWVSPGMAGVPDRLVLLPQGKIAFVETKAPGEKARPLQVAVMGKLKKLGFRVYVIDGEEGIEKMLEEIEAGQTSPPEK